MKEKKQGEGMEKGSLGKKNHFFYVASILQRKKCPKKQLRISRGGEGSWEKKKGEGGRQSPQSKELRGT